MYRFGRRATVLVSTRMQPGAWEHSLADILDTARGVNVVLVISSPLSSAMKGRILALVEAHVGVRAFFDDSHFPPKENVALRLAPLRHLLDREFVLFIHNDVFLHRGHKWADLITYADRNPDVDIMQPFINEVNAGEAATDGIQFHSHWTDINLQTIKEQGGDSNFVALYFDFEMGCKTWDPDQVSDTVLTYYLESHAILVRSESLLNPFFTLPSRWIAPTLAPDYFGYGLMNAAAGVKAALVPEVVVDYKLTYHTLEDLVMECFEHSWERLLETNYCFATALRVSMPRWQLLWSRHTVSELLSYREWVPLRVSSGDEVTQNVLKQMIALLYNIGFNRFRMLCVEEKDSQRISWDGEERYERVIDFLYNVDEVGSDTPECQIESRVTAIDLVSCYDQPAAFPLRSLLHSNNTYQTYGVPSWDWHVNQHMEFLNQLHEGDTNFIVLRRRHTFSTTVSGKPYLTLSFGEERECWYVLDAAILNLTATAAVAKKLIGDHSEGEKLAQYLLPTDQLHTCRLLIREEPLNPTREVDQHDSCEITIPSEWWNVQAMSMHIYNSGEAFLEAILVQDEAIE